MMYGPYNVKCHVTFMSALAHFRTDLVTNYLRFDITTHDNQELSHFTVW